MDCQLHYAAAIHALHRYRQKNGSRMYDPASRLFTFPVIVEFEDVDSYNIVHNSRIVDYFERARVHFLTETMGLDLHPDGIAMVIYSLDIRFNMPARLLDRLDAIVFVKSYDNYRLILGFRLMRGAQTLARGNCGIAFMETAKGNLIVAPETYAQAVAPYIRGASPEKRRQSANTERDYGHTNNQGI